MAAAAASDRLRVISRLRDNPHRRIPRPLHGGRGICISRMPASIAIHATGLCSPHLRKECKKIKPASGPISFAGHLRYPSKGAAFTSRSKLEAFHRGFAKMRTRVHI